MRRTGDAFIATGDYESNCACQVLLNVERDQVAPPCPKCGQSVGWTFVASPYLARGPRLKLPKVNEAKHPSEGPGESTKSAG